MAFITANLVRETTTTTGTGAAALAGAVTGHQSFAAKMAVGDVCYAARRAVDAGGVPTGQWETGLYTYSATNQLTLTTLDESSTGSAISWSAGTQVVYITVPAAQVKWMRERLTAARTYYVRSDGSDSNSGLVNSSGGAFLTIQKAIDTVASLDMDVYQVTIQLGDATYTAPGILKRCIGDLAPIIQGNSGTPANVHVSIATATTSAFSYLRTAAGPTTFTGPGQHWIIKDLKVTATRAGLEVYGAGNVISFSNINFGVCAFHYLASAGGNIQPIGSYSVSGNATYHALLSSAGNMSNLPLTMTLLANVTVTDWIYATRVSTANVVSYTVTLGAFTVTGRRYNSESGSAINTGGGGANVFPGTTSGVSTTGYYT